MNNRKSIVLSSVILIILLFLPSAGISANNPKPLPESSRELTKLFCKLDFEGARLSTDSYQKSDIAKFLVPGEFESPGWDTVVLVTKYKIEKENLNDKQASVTVSYDVIGTVSSDLTVMKHKAPYTFRFKKQKNRWVMIEPYDLPQHISIDTAIKHLEGLLKIQGEVEPSTTAVIEKLKQLKRRLNKSIQPDRD